MSNVVSMARKELQAYFLSPLFYVVAFFFLVISGVGFSLTIANPSAEPTMSVFGLMVFLLFPICPALTMHLFSEERRSGTIELLMTYPLKDWQVVAGKYFASLILLITLVLCTFTYPLFLLIYGEPDIGSILTGYLGFTLLGASFLAIGILGSSLAKSQMLAFAISSIIVFGLWALYYAGNLIGPGHLGSIVRYLPLLSHFNNFAQGLLDTRDLVFLVSFIFFCLFTAVRVVEIKRWK